MWLLIGLGLVAIFIGLCVLYAKLENKIRGIRSTYERRRPPPMG